MASRVLWNVECGAARSDGQRCHAWSIRGGFVCRCHGGATSQARGLAAERLKHAKYLNQHYPGWQAEPEKWWHLLTPGRSWHGPRPY
jgi:hypothetical protein